VAEDYRVSVRNHRRDGLEMLKELEKDKTSRRTTIATGTTSRGSDEGVRRADRQARQAKEDEIMAV